MILTKGREEFGGPGQREEGEVRGHDQRLLAAHIWTHVVNSADAYN